MLDLERNDLNGDGRVDGGDVALVASLAVALEPEETTG